MHIREANEDDAKGIAPLMLDLYERWDRIEPVDRIDRDWFLSGKHIELLEKWITDEKRLSLIGEDDDMIIGYLMAEVLEREPFFQPVGCIDEAYNLPAYRGMGIGSRMFDRAMQWFEHRDVSYVLVDTHSFDKEAVRYWEGRGFEEFNKVFKLDVQTYHRR